MSGPVLFLSSGLALLCLVLLVAGRDRNPAPGPGHGGGATEAPGKAHSVQEVLSGEFKRQPKKNPDAGQGRLRALVHDAAGGLATGAVVQVIPCDPEAGILEPRTEYREYWEAPANAAGFVEFRTLPAGDYVVLATRGDGFGAARAAVSEGGAFSELFLAVTAAMPRSGRVLDTDGKPVAGAQVVPIRAADWPGDSNPYRFLPAVTDEDGVFLHPLLPEGTWQMLVWAKGYAPALVTPDAGGTYRAVLGVGETLVGRFVRPDGDRPLNGAKVWIQAQDVPGETHATRTNGQGQFTLGLLRATEYLVRLDAEHYTAESRVSPGAFGGSDPDPATPGGRNMKIDSLSGAAVATRASAEGHGLAASGPAAPPVFTITAREVGSIRGRVLEGESGFARAGVPVSAWRADAQTPAASARSDQAGYYHLKALEPGQYALSVSRARGQVFVVQDSDAVVVAAGQQTAGPDFWSALPVALSGRVLGESGKPVADANIVVSLPGAHGEDLIVAADEEGDFLVEGLHAQDQVVVRAEKMGAKSGEFGPVTIGPAGMKEILLRLQEST